MQDQGKTRILVAEDDDRLRAMLTSTLSKAGFDVVAVADGEQALLALAESAPALLVLDVEMPHVDGREVLRRIRRTSTVAVIMVTGLGEDVDRVVGLELGADDYMVKPVYPRELVARVHAVLRRAPRPSSNTPLVFGSLHIEIEAREARLKGDALELTPREFDLLAFLASHPRRSFTRRQLLEQVWGSSPQWQDPSTVTEHVRRLRNKLDRQERRGPAWIVTVRRAGYRFEP